MIKTAGIILLGVCIGGFISCQSGVNRKSPSDQLFEWIPLEKSGISFSNHITENYDNFVDLFNYVYDGAGVAVGDINNDDLPDIYLVGNQVPNKLYLNKGDFEFEDITATAGVDGGAGWHNGVVMVDINHDGYLDIYVTRGGWKDTEEERKNLLFINQGNLTFEESASDFGLDESGHSIHASFFDMDNDGDLDVYITNRPDTYFIPIPEVVKGKQNPGESARDKLYINEAGTYKEIGLQAGITRNFGYGLSVVTADVNQDGFTDVFVANDFVENDYLYINQGDNTFKESIRDATNHISFYSMGTDIVDFNNDGLEDIVVSEMLPEDYIRSKTTMAPMSRQGYQEILDHGFHYQYMHNVLHLNRGNGYFSEIAQLAGISKTDWSWAALGCDFDNDGYRDLFITNGFKRDVYDKDVYQERVRLVQDNYTRFSSKDEMYRALAKDLINLYKSNKIANYMFRNNGDLTFDDVGNVWGFSLESFSHGAATGDFDRDGDLDLVINNMDEEAFLYRNEADKLGKNYLQVRLEGPHSNNLGLGAKINLKYKDKGQFFQMKTVRGYLSSCEPIAHFGLNTITNIDTLLVTWPDGRQNMIRNVKPNQLLTISHRDSKPEKIPEKITGPILSEITGQFFDFPFVHVENDFDDYKDQTLLPHSLSRSGPFTATGDVNLDGLEDIYVGGASGQAGQLFIQNINGRFDKKANSAFDRDKDYEDMGSLLFDADGDGAPDLYVVSGGSEFPHNSNMYQDRLYLNDGKGHFSRSNNLPEITDSGSCVVSADYDGDGDLDLFVGGRLVPGSYPLPAKSYLLRNEKGKFEEVIEDIAPEFKTLGMVTTAVWSDIDGQGDQELVVAGEWMPIRVFKIAHGKLEEISPSLNLTHTKGWWNSLVSTDYDNDGDQDLVAGNLGLNYKFKATPQHPFHIFADDFDRNGTPDVVLATYYNDELVPVHDKKSLENQMPGITRQFLTYRSFAEASLKEIIGPALDKALHYEVNNFASLILENSDGDFKIRKLPVEAQFSAVNGIAVLDFNNDGIKDLLLGGNKFNVEYETTRADASVGLLLKGRPDGSFQALPAERSELYIPYDVKSITPITIHRNRQGILVGSNQDTLRLFNVNKDVELKEKASPKI